jgi:hypothetical protein
LNQLEYSQERLENINLEIITRHEELDKDIKLIQEKVTDELNSMVELNKERSNNISQNLDKRIEILTEYSKNNVNQINLSVIAEMNNGITWMEIANKA